MQALYWAMFAAICAYQAALLQARGFPSTQTGALMALRCLSGILFQPLLGGFADRHPRIPLKAIVAASLLLSLAVGLLFALVPMGLLGTALVLVVLGGFEISAYPLMDAMAVQFIAAGVPIRYSLGRGIGSMAYALTCVGLGFQVSRLGVESTLLTHSVLVLLTLLAVAVYPTFPPALAAQAGREEPPHSVLWLLRSNPRFSLMLLAILVEMTACLPLSNFLVNVIEDRGGDSAGLGLALFLMGASELPAAFLFQRLRRSIGSGKVLFLSMIFVAVKALALLLAPNYLAILLVQPVQMLGYGLFTPASVYYVDESVPPSDRVRGQTLMMVASNGMGGMLGSFLAGGALDLGQALPMGGANLMLLCCLILGLLSALLAFLSVKKA